MGHWAWILIPVPSTWSHFYFSGNIVSKLGSVLVFLDSFSICSLQLLDNSHPTLFWKKWSQEWPCWSNTQHRTWKSLPPLRAHQSLAIDTTFHSSLLDGFALLLCHPSETNGHRSWWGLSLRNSRDRKEKEEWFLVGDRLCSGSQPRCLWSAFLLCVMSEFVFSAQTLNSCPKH